jgi:transcriptional regulator with XRE-family HTH domain
MIRAERLRLGLTQQQVADGGQVSVETIRKYEGGFRSPSRDRLTHLLASMELPQSRARAVLNAAGFASPDTLFPGDRSGAYYSGEAEARAEIEISPWPKFVVNDALDVVAANRATIGLWDLEPGFEASGRTRAQVNLLAIMAEPRVAHHLANLDACFVAAVGILKAAHERGERSDDGAGFVEAVLAECAARNPSTIRRLLRIWETTPAANPRAQAIYEVLWRDGESLKIRFVAVMSVCSEQDGLVYHDWHPADAASHANLERLLESQPSRPPMGRPNAGSAIGHAFRT